MIRMGRHLAGVLAALLVLSAVVAVVIGTSTASAATDKWPKPDYAKLEGALNRQGITVCHYDAPPEPDSTTGAYEKEDWYLYRTSDLSACPPKPGPFPNLSVSGPNSRATLDAYTAAQDTYTAAQNSKAATLGVYAFSSQRIYDKGLRSVKQLQEVFLKGQKPENTTWTRKPLLLELDLSTQDVTPQVKAALKKLKAKVFIQGR